MRTRKYCMEYQVADARGAEMGDHDNNPIMYNKI